VQEALTNVFRHAGATSVDVVIEPAEPMAQDGRLCARVRVSDNGRGMAPEIAARATEPLFTTDPRGIKTGWGLSSSAGFIRQSGGAMTIASVPAQGTTVKISLPLENG